MIPALTLTNIVFTYPGTSEPLLDGIDVTFARGWTAVLGDNGIGKTTLAKLAIGRLSPDAGRISPTPNRLHTGYCPQNTDETPENLEDFACDWSPQAMEIRRELGIGDDWPWRPGTLSGGEAKRLQIACALATDPDVLVLDEPTSGLDPIMQEQFIDFVKEEKARGKTILLSSHIFSEVDATCDRIAIIKDGKIMSVFVADDIRYNENKTFRVAFGEKRDYDLFLHAGFGIITSDENKLGVKFGLNDADTNKLIRLLSTLSVKSFTEDKFTLEDYFMQFYYEDKEFGGVK